MKKSDLKDGMVVQLRDGAKYIFLEEIQNLCGKQYGYNITSFNEDLTHNCDSDKDIIKVYKPRKNGCILNVIKDSDELIWERKEQKIQLTQEQIEILKALKTLGYNWIARDANNRISGYSSKPYKNNFHWDFISTLNSPMDTLKSGLDFIKWEDDEPRRIEDLLKLEVKGEK